MKKYEFTGETKEVRSRSGMVTLHRIRATIDFGAVVAGELGGWIEREENLQHAGNAWVIHDAKVYGNAVVCNNAEVYGNALVYGDAAVHGNARVGSNAKVHGDVQVCGNAVVCNNAEVYGNALVYGNARVYDNAKVYGYAAVHGNAWVSSNAKVHGDVQVHGNARVGRNADVFSASHILVIGPIGSRNAFTTFYRDKDNEITVKCGCFLGTIDKFLERVAQTHGDSKYARVYQAAAELARLQIIGEGGKA